MRIPFSVLGGTALYLSTAFASNAQTPAKAQAPLEEIIVTATRRETNLQETPLAISAFNQETLDENHVVSLLDMRGLVPNLQFFENGDHAVPLIFIRGLGTRNQTEAGDQGIAFYSDGVFAARSQGTTVMLYDLDRIEVLRGPQGTLFGRNSTGGAIALHTAKPSTDGVRRVRRDHRRQRLAVRLPRHGQRAGDRHAGRLRIAGATEEQRRPDRLRARKRVRDQSQVRHGRPELVPGQLDVRADRQHQLVPRLRELPATRARATSAASTSTTASTTRPRPATWTSTPTTSARGSTSASATATP